MSAGSQLLGAELLVQIISLKVGYELKIEANTSHQNLIPRNKLHKVCQCRCVCVCVFCFQTWLLTFSFRSHPSLLDSPARLQFFFSQSC